MKRSILAWGVVGLLGCGGMDNDGGQPTAAETSAAVSGGSNAATSEAGATPRVARFAMMPAASLERGSIKPTAWTDKAAAALESSGEEQRGTFDPAMLRVAEAHRRAMQAQGGAQ